MIHAKFIFDKCYVVLLFSLIPCSFLFSETIFINNYFINVILSILIILSFIKNIIEKKNTD
jgi:hypothetical protein